MQLSSSAVCMRSSDSVVTCSAVRSLQLSTGSAVLTQELAASNSSSLLEMQQQYEACREDQSELRRKYQECLATLKVLSPPRDAPDQKMSDEQHALRKELGTLKQKQMHSKRLMGKLQSKIDALTDNVATTVAAETKAPEGKLHESELAIAELQHTVGRMHAQGQQPEHARGTEEILRKEAETDKATLRSEMEVLRKSMVERVIPEAVSGVQAQRNKSTFNLQSTNTKQNERLRLMEERLSEIRAEQSAESVRWQEQHALSQERNASR